ncbi:Protein phosphatase 2C 6 [Tilletia horrida]|nr:Protein phosphatase 2C 6 [Tilletia horrida]
MPTRALVGRVLTCSSCARRVSVSPSRPLREQRRGFQDFFRVRTGNGSSSARVSLAPNSVYGIATSRGTRPYQEDAYAVACLLLPTGDLAASYHRPPAVVQVDGQTASKWEEQIEDSGADVKALACQLMWFGCYDGHGGQAVSAFLKSDLHRIFESVDPSLVTDTVQYTRSLGGYFRRFTGGEISRWVRQEQLKPVRGGPSAAVAPGRTGRPPNQRPPAIMSAAELQREEEAKTQQKPRTLADLIDGIKLDGRNHAAQAATAAEDVVNKEGEEEVAEQEEDPPPEDIAPDSPSSSASASAQKSKKPTRRKGEPVPREELEDFPSFTQKIDPPEELARDNMTLAERATLSWLIVSVLTSSKRHLGFNLSLQPLLISARQADRLIQRNDDLDVGGSTASVALLHSLDVPAVPFYSSKQVGMTVVHVGDTRILLCAKSNGEAIPLTNYHHPDAPAESERLRRVGAGMVTDSFGEARWMGALANTRAFGDSRYKRAGVTAEPEVITRIINGDDFAFIIAFSDGIGGVMSDQEIVDLCRDARHPSQAAKSVLTFAEELGSEDNCTVLCIPLRGWGQVGGKDTTKERRELRRSKTDIFRDHRQ